MLLPMVFVAIWDTHVTRATAIIGGKSSASAECAPPLSCTDDHANDRRLMHGIGTRAHRQMSTFAARDKRCRNGWVVQARRGVELGLVRASAVPLDTFSR